MNDYHNKPVYYVKIFSYDKDKIDDKTFLGIKMNWIRYKAEIREEDNYKIEVLLRNWSQKK